MPLIFMYLGRRITETVTPLDAMVIDNLRNAGIKVGPSTEGVPSVSLMVAGDMCNVASLCRGAQRLDAIHLYKLSITL